MHCGFSLGNLKERRRCTRLFKAYRTSCFSRKFRRRRGRLVVDRRRRRRHRDEVIIYERWVCDECKDCVGLRSFGTWLVATLEYLSRMKIDKLYMEIVWRCFLVRSSSLMQSFALNVNKAFTLLLESIRIFAPQIQSHNASYYSSEFL